MRENVLKIYRLAKKKLFTFLSLSDIINLHNVRQKQLPSIDDSPCSPRLEQGLFHILGNIGSDSFFWLIRDKENQRFSNQRLENLWFIFIRKQHTQIICTGIHDPYDLYRVFCNLIEDYLFAYYQISVLDLFIEVEL